MDHLLNKIHLMDCMDLMSELPDKSIDLAIVDPPYFEVKGKFDFIWDSFDDYLKDVERWVKEFKRVLADNGSLLYYGHAKKIAYSQIILDKYFNLENNITWIKKDSMMYQYYSIETARVFTPNNERILFYSNEIGMTGLEFIEKEYIAPKNPFSMYLKAEFKKANISNKEIAKLFPSKTGGLTGCVSNWLNGDNVITEEQYLKIRSHLNNEYLRREYEDLRREYEDLRRPFNNYQKLTDCMEFSQEGHILGKIDHDTVKPIALTTALINTCSRKNDIVFIPFSGSGTEAIVCASNSRNFIACELDPDYHKASLERLQPYLDQGNLF